MARRASASAASEFHAWPAAGRGRARAASPRTAAGKRRILRVPRSPADERPPRRVPRPRRRGGRRDGPGAARGGARRGHPARGVRQSRAAAVRIPARIARGWRALGALHLPRHRAARGVALPRPRDRAVDEADRLAGGGCDRRSRRPRGAAEAGEARLSEIVARLGGRHALAPLALSDAVPPIATQSRYPRAAFERDVAKILEYIAAGDTFQTVLSCRQEAPGAVDPLLLYRYLRALNPAPYLLHLQFDDFAFVGSSPEVLVRVEGGKVTVRPIAGTRPRGETREDDEALARALLAD